jgi:uncharacterized protein YciI
VRHFLLFYETAPDYLEKRALYRSVHLEKAWASAARGELMMGGALSDPAGGALLLFKTDDKSIVEEFAKTDPYVTNGLITSWHIREWLTVAGEGAANPVRP